MAKPIKYIRHSASIIKNQGLLTFTIAGLQKIQRVKQGGGAGSLGKRSFVSLVSRQDAMGADWSRHPYRPANRKKDKPPYVVNWVMSPPGGGGGHQNIFRFIEHLDGLGYMNNVYIYSTTDPMSLAQARENVSSYCKAKNVKFYRYKGSMVDSDVVFATGWETAYPVLNVKTTARKMYFVQDFEPYFYPVGTDYVLAENTYRFGFHGITAGGWLAQKLNKEYGMTCDYYDFSADTDLYKFTNKSKRKGIFFYARPVTERRGFDLGIMALELFHKKMPEYAIHLAGWDVSEYDVPFPYVNHKAMSLDRLSDLYNECAAALVISLTNMSLMPLELLACGTIPVVTDGPNNRLVSDNKYIAYAYSTPAALANRLVEVVTRKDLPTYAKSASASIDTGGWGKSLEKFEAALRREFA